MLSRLPYRIQIPLGLGGAVVVAALLVTTVAAQIGARTARKDTLATADRAVVLLSTQSQRALAADDTWAVFTLLRGTVALLPGAEAGHARAAVLDADGRVFAASEPASLKTGQPLLGEAVRGLRLPQGADAARRLQLDQRDGAVTLIDPIRSEDGQLQGYVYVEIDAPVFAPDWAALSQPALIGAVLAVCFLVPAGWWVGRRMTRPVERVANLIGRIGHEDPALLLAEVPRSEDPELGRISSAVGQLIGELQVRRQAEQRAMSAERMAAVGRLTAAVAHEINNPLGGLLTATQTLRLHGDDDAIRGRSVSLIERGLQQIRTTVAALLPQARVEDRPLEVNDLADIVALVLPFAQRHAVDLRSHADVAAALHVPSAALRQVMLNLLLNAVQAAGEHGQVNAQLTADAKTVRFAVSNSGARLSGDALEASIAAESGNDPRGFGLWVCREVATQYGGAFTLGESNSAAALSTRLEFWIPNRERNEAAAVA